MIPVTKTFFPPLEEYHRQLEKVWQNEWLTNRGALVRELEDKLKAHLQVPEMILTTNGTLPIQIALKLLADGGEVITTPFSYVATTSSIVWEHCRPIFVDIHPEYLTIDETKVEAAITENTTAILATHVFGNPCAVEDLERIAAKHGLRIIYDAAHCFGVRYKGRSLFKYGDISTCSFHATKIFQTGEGGAMFCNVPELYREMFYSHNFGHNGPTDFSGVGINAKMSELQAAMGLAVFPHLEEIFQARRNRVEDYDRYLDLTRLKKLKLREGVVWNYSYYPVIFDSETQLLKVVESLKEQDIIPRRYFYPSLNTLTYLEAPEMPVSESISQRVLCLPLYPSLEEEQLQKISRILNAHL